MSFNLCEDCEKYKIKYRVYINKNVVDVCGRCAKKKKYSDCEVIPIDEFYMDEEEREGWDSLAEYYND